jgi:hypothetical protein
LPGLTGAVALSAPASLLVMTAALSTPPSLLVMTAAPSTSASLLVMTAASIPEAASAVALVPPDIVTVPDVPVVAPMAPDPPGAFAKLSVHTPEIVPFVAGPELSDAVAPPRPEFALSDSPQPAAPTMSNPARSVCRMSRAILRASSP